MNILRSGRIRYAGCMVLAAVLGVFVCRKKPDSPVIARIGNSVLTLDDLYESIPREYRNKITREQNIRYVKQWIDNELLYQEALRRKIHKEEKIRSRLQKMKRDLLCAEMISRYSVGREDSRITKTMVAKYYEAHKDSFVREEDVFKFSEIVVEDLKTAWQVRNKVTADNFLDLAARYSDLPVLDPRSVPYVPLGEIPPALAGTVPRIRAGGTTSPIKTESGYSIVRVWDKQPAGSVCALSEVRDDIVNRLSAEMQKREIERMLSDLRTKVDYEYNFDAIPGPPAGTGGEEPAAVREGTGDGDEDEPSLEQ